MFSPGGFANDPQQSFFLHITPHPEIVEKGPYEARYNTLRHSGTQYLNSAYGSESANGGSASVVRTYKNITRIMIPLRDDKVWDIIGELLVNFILFLTMFDPGFSKHKCYLYCYGGCKNEIPNCP